MSKQEELVVLSDVEISALYAEAARIFLACKKNDIDVNEKLQVIVETLSEELYRLTAIANANEEATIQY